MTLAGYTKLLPSYSTWHMPNQHQRSQSSSGTWFSWLYRPASLYINCGHSCRGTCQACRSAMMQETLKTHLRHVTKHSRSSLTCTPYFETLNLEYSKALLKWSNASLFNVQISPWTLPFFVVALEIDSIRKKSNISLYLCVKNSHIYRQNLCRK